VDTDLAKSVVAPRVRKGARPPRTLPWQDVKRILHAIGRSEPPGKRDFAILLLLATCGLGAAEVLGLRLQDVDWKAGILRARRPKTSVSIELPLLPPVARALTAYLRWERPPAKGTAHLFLRTNMSYVPITSGAIRHRIRHYASQVGVSAEMIGAHAFRHSHASRQVDAGANLKVVSEIRYAVPFFIGSGPREAAFLQSLRALPQSAAIPHQGFQSRTRAIGKQEQMPTQRVLPKLIAHGSVQSVEALAHVHGFHRYIDLCRQPQPVQRITPRPRESTGST
jgi:hypothetical protein